MIEKENLIGHFSYFGDKLNPITEISFREYSHISTMSLFENDSKLLITDYEIQFYMGSFVKPFK
jgi:hypothetical protein